jgi:ATP/ADP translocase
MIERFIDVRRGEGTPALLALSTLFALIAGHTILETARDALFLERLPASSLALSYLALAALGLVLPIYNARFVRSFGRRNALVVTLMIAALGTTLWHFQPLSVAALYGLYLWSGLLGTALAVQFWMFAGQLFTVAQGRRLFPGIAAGGVLGAVAGGVVAAVALEIGARVSGQASVRALLLVAAACFIAAAFLLTAIPTEDVGTPFRTAKAAAPWRSGLAVLSAHPHLLRVAFFVAAATFALLLADYLLKFVAKGTLAPGELGPFFARYYALLNALALAVQLLVAERLIRRLGVIAALTLLPASLLVGGAAVILSGGRFLAVLLTKGADGALRHSLHRVATELAYLPVPGEVRDRAKSLIDAVFVRGAQALGAGVILILSLTSLESTAVLAALVVGSAAAWLWFGVTLKGGYVDLLRSELGRGAVDPRALGVDELDVDSVEAVLAALSSADSERVTAAMNLLVEAKRTRLIPALILYHPSDAVVMKALDIIARIDEQDWRPHAARLVESASMDVRVAALRALGRACDAELLRPALGDPSPEVRAHAAFQLARCEGGRRPEEHPAIQQLLAEAATASSEVRRRIRLGLLAALREDADDKWLGVLAAVAEGDPSPQVVDAVAHAVMRVPDARFVPLLIDRLDGRDARSAVRGALRAIGEPAFEALAAALTEAGARLAVRRHVPITIAAFGTQRAADLLMAQLQRESDGLVRYRVLRGLGRLVTDHAVRVDGAVIEAEIEKNLIEHLSLLSLWLALDATDEPEAARVSGVVLRALCADKIRQASERAFRLFKILHRGEDVRSIYVALGAPDRRVRAHAQEFLEVLALAQGRRCRDLLRIVADDLAPSDKVARAADHIPTPPAGAEAALQRLGADRDEAMMALATFHAAALGLTEASPDVEALLARRSTMRPRAMEVADG